MEINQRTLCYVIFGIVYKPMTYQEIEYTLGLRQFSVSRERLRKTLKLLCDCGYCYRHGNRFFNCLYPDLFAIDRRAQHEVLTQMDQDERLQ